MALIFSEEFEGTIGTPPSGWTTTGTATQTTSGYHNQRLAFTGNATAQKSFSSQTSYTIFFVTKGGQVQHQGLQQVISGTNTSFTPILTFQYNTDRTISVANGAGANTSTNVILNGVGHENYKGQELDWTFIQLDATLSNTTIGTNSAIKVVAAVRLNGESIATGTGTYTSTLSAYIDNVKWTGDANSNSSLDSVYMYSPILSTPIVTPNNGVPNARISQALFEYLKLQSDSDARVSQAVIENIRLPSTSKARVSQAVIELIRVEFGGWQVYEA